MEENGGFSFLSHSSTLPKRKKKNGKNSIQKWKLERRKCAVYKVMKKKKTLSIRR